MALNPNHAVFFLLCFVALSIAQDYRNLTITTTRVWTRGRKNDICLHFRDFEGQHDNWNENFTEAGQLLRTRHRRHIIPYPSPTFNIREPVCGSDIEFKNFLQLNETGTIWRHSKGDDRPSIADSIDIRTHAKRKWSKQEKALLSTDRSLYKPGETVHIRAVYVRGPYMRNTQKLLKSIKVKQIVFPRKEIVIAQWLNVATRTSIFHFSFQLPANVSEGKYRVELDGKIASSNFRVQDASFKVSIRMPRYVRSITTEHKIEICFRNEFGEPVEGFLHMWVSIPYETFSDDYLKVEEPISGCKEFSLSSDREFPAFQNKQKVHVLVWAKTSKDAIPIITTSNSIDVRASSLYFGFKGRQQFVKPGLPYMYKIYVTDFIGKPADNELLTVCDHENKCFNKTTSADGNFKLNLPTNWKPPFRVTAPLRNDRPTMLLKRVGRYLSPTNSSLDIVLENTKIACNFPSPTIEFELPVNYVALPSKDAQIVVQAIVKRKIIYTKYFTRDLVNGDLVNYDDDAFTEPLKPVAAPNVRGHFKLPIELKYIPTDVIRLVVWYENEENEIVADLVNLDVKNCNKLNVKWEATETSANTRNLVIKAKPFSVCSLGVSDQASKPIAPRWESFVSSFSRIVSKYPLRSVKIDGKIFCPNKILYSYGNYEIIGQNTRTHRRKRSFILGSDYIYLVDMNAAQIFLESDLLMQTNAKIRYGCLTGIDRDYGFFDRGERSRFVPVTDKNEKTVVKGRTKNHGTLFWDFITLGSSGVFKKEVFLPGTNASWVASLVCHHDTDGLGIDHDTLTF